MNFDLTMKRMSKKHGFDFTMQELQFDARRAVIPCESWNELDCIRNVLRRVKSFEVTDWKRFEGVFEGYVFVMDAAEAEQLRAEQKAERARLEDWWQRYHDADAETRRLMACGAIA